MVQRACPFDMPLAAPVSLRHRRRTDPMHESRSVLITGAGLIAAHAARELQNRGHAVVLYDCNPCGAYLETVLDLERAAIVAGDITDCAALESALKFRRVDCVVHTAALIGTAVLHDLVRGVHTNVVGTMAVAEAAHAAGARRLVHCSSIALYALERLVKEQVAT